jgi:hypothetical protein
MSYKQAMKWARKHPKGTRQHLIMSTNSGFWPARAFLENDYWPYADACRVAGVEPVSCEIFYRHCLGVHRIRLIDECVALTKAGDF